MQIKSKILVIRFSSFGDITQCLSVPSKLKEHFPNSEIHWVTRHDFQGLVQSQPLVHKVWTLDRKSGMRGLLYLAFILRSEKFTHVYDAHNNTRSFVIGKILTLFQKTKFIRRPIYRWRRFLLFNFRINHFEQPFSGQRDLIQPLSAWGIKSDLPPAPQMILSANDDQKANELLSHFNSQFITLAPSAAYVLKRWPKEYWIELIQSLPNENFVLLGGGEDTFIEEIAATAPKRCLNLAGKCDFTVNGSVIKRSKLLICNDTGLLHIAEQLGHPCIALMGPAPFGFPSRHTTKKMELNLNCRPCSKHGQGPCRNQEFHQCLRGLSPTLIAKEVQNWI